MWNKILEFLHIRKPVTDPTYVEETAPDIPEGYDESNNTIVRLVSKRRPKKAYQTTGIEDVVAKNNWKAWIYLAPVLVLIAVFLIYPLINTIFISFTNDYNYATGEYQFLTFANFGKILGIVPINEVCIDTFVKYAIVNTLILTFVTVPVSIFLALIISVALNSIKWFQKVLQTVFFLPYVTNAIAVGMVFSVMFDTKGIINFIFKACQTDANGVVHPVDWLHSTRFLGMIPLILYIVWGSIPFKILVFLSGLQGIDKQYYQAAQIDACPHWKVLWKITVPLLSPQILYIMITSFISAFKEYTHIVGLFKGPETVPGEKNMLTIVFYIYEELSNNTELAAAAAVFLFVIILLFTFIQFGVSKKRVHY